MDGELQAMLKFETEQKIFQIGKIQIGGQPGQLPTVLIGTIFYERHKIVKDMEKGIFDKEAAEQLIRTHEELSERTGVPCMIDVVGVTPTAILKYLDFVAEKTEMPILIDSTSAEVKIAGIKHANEVGLADRVVYNSITHHVTQEELDAIRENNIKAAVILTYNPHNVWPKGRIELLKGNGSKKGLLALAEEAGIEKPLVDTAVLDVPTLAAEAVKLVRNEFGLPAGGAPANAVLEWKRVKEISPDAKKVCMANAVTAMQYAGANFLLYGPIRYAPTIFPAVAMADAIIAYSARLKGVSPRTKDHPLFNIF